MGKIITKVPTIPKLPTRTRVAAYARVSDGKDAMLRSLAAQVSHYSSYIQGHPGWEYVGVYADEATTGTKDSRPEFQRMLADCRVGKIDLVLTKSISRFARNTVTLLQTVRELKGIGIDIYFEEQNIHFMSREGELMLSILASYAQEESRSVSEKTVNGGFEKTSRKARRLSSGSMAIGGKMGNWRLSLKKLRWCRRFTGGTWRGWVGRALPII